MTATRLQRREALVVGTLAFIWLAGLAWCRPLMLPDEGRYVGVAWEMMRSGHWLTPTLNGLPYFHKPPLFYWMTAASMTAFGVHEWAARAAPLAGAWMAAMSTFLFLRRWRGTAVARAAVLALLCQPLFYLGGQFANLDMLVAGCITATICLLAHVALSLERRLPHRTHLQAAYVFAALGVLAKGLIGAVIPAIVIGAWLIARRQWRTLVRLVNLPAAMLGAVVVVPWFVAMQWQFPNFLHYFVVVQHFQRFATGGFNNVQPFWFYPAVLLISCLPWLPWVRPNWHRAWFSEAQQQEAQQHGSLRLLWPIWAGSVLLFFSLPQSKLVGYILPAVPPLMVLLAEGFMARHSAGQARWGRWWACAAASAMIGVVVVGITSIHPTRSTRELAEALGHRHAAGEPVVMLNNYAFDLAWYARLPAPAIVVDDWHLAPHRDNWRKELSDAGAFDPALARSTLIDRTQWTQVLCAAPVVWLIGPSSSSESWPWLKKAEVVATVRDTTLWRWQAPHPALTTDPPACAERPNAD